eukprot:TRINITY_DN18304_c0_g1_i1.p1 TRINITY_DN18304_c0_g1~~TRINITY_DN18304_c0_g1_i1.p1  ORF type:complete len:398 (-),score=102.42 TRINITY_DN18304_c0_g1_i1:24-1184(-)
MNELDPITSLSFADKLHLFNNIDELPSSALRTSHNQPMLSPRMVNSARSHGSRIVSPRVSINSNTSLGVDCGGSMSNRDRTSRPHSGTGSMIMSEGFVEKVIVTDKIPKRKVKTLSITLDSGTSVLQEEVTLTQSDRVVMLTPDSSFVEMDEEEQELIRKMNGIRQIRKNKLIEWEKEKKRIMAEKEELEEKVNKITKRNEKQTKKVKRSQQKYSDKKKTIGLLERVLQQREIEIQTKEEELKMKQKEVDSLKIRNMELEDKLSQGKRDVFIALERRESAEMEVKRLKETILVGERERQRQREEIKKLNAVALNLQQSIECSICNDGYCTITLIPCKHQILCGDCAEKVDYCPVCRTIIQARMECFTNFAENNGITLKQKSRRTPK